MHGQINHRVIPDKDSTRRLSTLVIITMNECKRNNTNSNCSDSNDLKISFLTTAKQNKLLFSGKNIENGKQKLGNR